MVNCSLQFISEHTVLNAVYKIKLTYIMKCMLYMDYNSKELIDVCYSSDIINSSYAI